MKPRNYNFTATQMTPITTSMVPASVVRPEVYYTPKVMRTIDYIVAKATGEVGWLGTVEKMGKDYLITNIYIPPQTVTSVTTDIEADAVAKIALQIMDDGGDLASLRYWGHSHVNMGVTPSSTDEAQIDEYMEQSDWFIRGIYNKKGESKVDVFDRTNGVVFQCVNDGLNTPQLTAEEKKHIDTQFLNVKTPTYNNMQTQPVTGFIGKPHYNGMTNTYDTIADQRRSSERKSLVSYAETYPYEWDDDKDDLDYVFTEADAIQFCKTEFETYDITTVEHLTGKTRGQAEDFLYACLT